MNHRAVFESQRLRLTAFDLETDPTVLSGWTADPATAQRLGGEPLHLLTCSEARKKLEAWQKDMQEGNRLYLFALRPLEEERLIGFLRIWQVMWVQGAAEFDLVIGAQPDRTEFAMDALRLGLNYAFEEMHLFRVSVWVEGNDQLSRELFESARFTLEVRQRQAVYRDGQYHDRLLYGLLRPEWAIFTGQQLGVPA